VRSFLKENLTKEKFEELRKKLESYSSENGYNLAKLSNGVMFSNSQWVVFDKNLEAIKDLLDQLIDNTEDYLEDHFGVPCTDLDSYHDCLECDSRAECDICEFKICTDRDCDNCKIDESDDEIYCPCVDCEYCLGDLQIDIAPIILEGRVLFEEDFRENFLEFLVDRGKKEQKRYVERLQALDNEYKAFLSFHNHRVNQIQNII
jgi:hypothetical protein